MKILQINQSDIKGGAALVGYYLQQKLGGKMLVSSKASSKDSIMALPAGFWSRFLNFIFNTDYFTNSQVLNNEWFKESSIVHCHNLHGRYFKLSDLVTMSQAKPLVWTLHDEWAITSNSAHTFDNNKQQQGFYQQASLAKINQALFGYGLTGSIAYLWLRELYKRLVARNRHWFNYKNSIYRRSKLDIVVPSKWLEQRVKQSALGQQAVHLIYNGIDVNKFKPGDQLTARKKLNLPANKKIILIIIGGSNNILHKGWNYAQKVMKNLAQDDNICFVCVGQAKPQIKSDNIIYISQINQDLLPLYYQASDLFLLTSLAETFGLVALEAMACSCPVVSFDVGGVKEVVEHKQTGYIAGYKDLAQLLAGIQWIFDLGPEKLRKIQLQARQRAETKFSLDLMVKNYYQLYSKLLQ